MSKSHEKTVPHHPDSTHHADKTDSPEDKAATAKTLLDDAQGRWLNKTQPEAVAKLIQDGVLPPGTSVIDFGKVAAHLDDDKKALTKLGSDPLPDVSTYAAAIAADKVKLAPAQSDLQTAQGSVDTIQKGMDARTNKNQQVQKDFDTITKDTKSTYFYADDLASLSINKSKSSEVRDAAKRLLDTFHSHGRGVLNSDYATVGLSSPYIDQGSITKKTGHDDLLNKGDADKLATATGARDKAQGAVDGINTDISNLQKSTDTTTNLQNERATVADRIKRQEDALQPDTSIADLGKIGRGDGYYQVAERLLGLHSKGYNRQQESEVQLLKKLLQDEERSLNNGQLPKYLKQNDELLKPERIAAVFDKLKMLSTPENASPS
jgi:succinate dehydrogenase flavin-adding protein (antitoxin of CptAB toxin-antitoxin module)